MIPPYDALMLPVLRHCSEKAWLMRDLIVRIADDLRLARRSARNGHQVVSRLPSQAASTGPRPS
jgi:hypothetical protein